MLNPNRKSQTNNQFKQNLGFKLNCKNFLSLESKWIVLINYSGQKVKNHLVNITLFWKPTSFTFFTKKIFFVLIDWGIKQFRIKKDSVFRKKNYFRQKEERRQQIDGTLKKFKKATFKSTGNSIWFQSWRLSAYNLDGKFIIGFNVHSE